MADVRWRDRWEPRFWIVPGAANLLLAAVGGAVGWELRWVALAAVLGVVMLSWAFAGVTTREIPWQYRAFQAVVMVGVLAGSEALPENLHVYCEDARGSGRAYISEYDLPGDLVAVVYDYGDGASFVASNGEDGRSHEYADPGTYTIRVTAVGDGRPRSDSCSVTVAF